jgi:hypothetical protein
VRAARKARLARLSVPLDDAEAAEVGRRNMLRLDAKLCAFIRKAMLRAGIDPACSRALRDIEERLVEFVDTPELQRADAAFKTAREREEDEDKVYDDDPREELIAELNRIGRHYQDESLPDFARASFMTVLAWAMVQDRVAGAEAEAEENPSPPFRAEREPSAAGEGL